MKHRKSYAAKGIFFRNLLQTSINFSNESSNIDFCLKLMHGNTLLFEALMKPVQLQCKSLMNKNLPSVMVYVHTNLLHLTDVNGNVALVSGDTLI